jgi:hypothetical protein
MRLGDYPIVMFFFSILTLSASVWLGAILRGEKELQGESREDYGVVLAAALTLLGLIIGFSFSMATSRYDARKNLEEAEANAIGTEYLRLDFLPTADAMAAKKLLRDYLDQRVLWYRERVSQSLRQIDAKTGQLQSDLWTAVKAPAATQPNPVFGLVVAGMNDVLNSQGYTQAAWWNRIPPPAWLLMFVIAVLCNGMIGYREGKRKLRFIRPIILPVIVSIAFYMIADIDSPRSGTVLVVPQNLLSLAASLPE